MTDRCDVFLSYSRNDLQAAATLRAELRPGRLSVFKDDDSIRAGDRWLDRLQTAIDACGSFVVLVGRDGVGRWIGAETQAALNRYFGPHEDAQRLPIFPILLGEARLETLPAFLRLFQTTPWNGSDPLPLHLLYAAACLTTIRTTPPSCSPSTSLRSYSPSPRRTSAAGSTASRGRAGRPGLPAVRDLHRARRLPRTLCRGPAPSRRGAEPPGQVVETGADRCRGPA
jgi:TIR domain-containing protein